jgi:hypothetical protein
MSIDHASAVWGYGSATPHISGQQAGLRRKRQFPIAPTTPGASASIRPYALPWLATADAFGVSFPAGTLGITTTISLPSPIGGTFNAGYESQWADLTSGTTIVPVPSVLPSGYTPNLETPWASYAVNPNGIHTKDGWTNQLWGPTGNPNGVTDLMSLSDFDVRSIFDGTNYVYQIPIAIPGTGCRAFRIKNNFTPTGVQPSCTISHNNNTGTRPAATDPGDTIDQTFTLASDLSYVNVGPVSAKTGVLSIFVMRFVVAPPPTTVVAGVWTIDISPRVDVPYVMTITGQGDLVAPGGIPS